MKSKIFIQIFALVMTSVILVFAAGILSVHANTKTIISERLATESELLISLLKTEDDIYSLNAYENRDNFRITVITESGKVLYESSIPGVLENHSDRVEVVGALNGSPVLIERYSDTFGCKMTYYATRSILDDGRVIVIRLAVKSSEISSYLRVAIPALALVLIISVIISLIVAVKISRSLSSKVKGVAGSLKSIGSKEYSPISTSTADPEFSAVFKEINSLNENIHTHIVNEERERIRLRSVLDAISQGIIALDLSGNTVFANEGALSLFGASENCIGRRLVHLIEDVELRQRISELLHSHGGSIEETVGNKELLITLRCVAQDMASSDFSHIIIITDITREKEIAREKSDFFANASHELKTPLTVMRGMSELMLSSGALDENGQKQAERIRSETVRMSLLISDMLKLSRLERRNGDEETSLLSLSKICTEVVHELSCIAEQKDVSVEIIGDGRITESPKNIYEMIENLVSNALNYNKQGGRVIIEISEEGDRVSLKVSDTGIGIAPEHLPRICERFYRVDKSRSKKTGGTGLGLAIVKHVCASCGAALSIESTLGEGTDIRVVFNKKSN